MCALEGPILVAVHRNWRWRWHWHCSLTLSQAQTFALSLSLSLSRDPGDSRSDDDTQTKYTTSLKLLLLPFSDLFSVCRLFVGLHVSKFIRRHAGWSSLQEEKRLQLPAAPFVVPHESKQRTRQC